MANHYCHIIFVGDIMPLVAITGAMGSGKSLALNYLLMQKFMEGKMIYANFHTKKPLISIYIESIDDIEKIRDGYAGLDELWSWLDSRDFKMKKNKKISRIILYSRKRGVYLFYTTQRFGQIEKRIRDNTDAIVEPILSNYVKGDYAKKLAMLKYNISPENIVPDHKDEVPLKCTIYWRTIMPKEGSSMYDISKPFKSKSFETLPFFQLFNTKEEIRDA